jgi:hypothetical protein
MPSESDEAWLLDAASALPIDSPLQHMRDVQHVAFSPDGKSIATSGSGASARLWDLASGKPVGESLDHEAGISSLEFSSDGRILATVTTLRTARLWDAATGLRLGPTLIGPQSVTSLAFTPDGRSVATAGHPRPQMRRTGGFRPGGIGMNMWMGGMVTAHSAVYLWPAPRPLAGDAERIVEHIRVLTASDFDSGDAIRPLGPRVWREHRRRLEALGGPATLSDR